MIGFTRYKYEFVSLPRDAGSSAGGDGALPRSRRRRPMTGSSASTSVGTRVRAAPGRKMTLLGRQRLSLGLGQGGDATTNGDGSAGLASCIAVAYLRMRPASAKHLSGCPVAHLPSWPPCVPPLRRSRHQRLHRQGQRQLSQPVRRPPRYPLPHQIPPQTGSRSEPPLSLPRRSRSSPW